MRGEDRGARIEGEEEAWPSTTMKQTNSIKSSTPE